MASRHFSVIHVVISLLSFLSLTSGLVPTYRASFCSNTTTFTPNSTYRTNLNHLLSSLSSNATRESGFYNTTAGQSPATTVYGLLLCRGDLTTAACQDCVANATKEIVQQYCPDGKEAWIWHDECMIRYSNRSFFSTVEEKPLRSFWNPTNVTEPNRFRRLVEATLNDLIPVAANAPPGAKKFATTETNFTSLQNLYSLVQCIPDISSSDCTSCLRRAMTVLPTCCDGKQGGRVLYTSCNFRFEVYPFYQMQSVPTPSPAPMLLPPAPGRVTRPEGKDQVSAQTVIAIVVPVLISILFFVGYCFLRRRVKKKYNVATRKNVTNDITTVANDINIIESLQFDLATIEVATNMFSNDNKLGRGGFGVVYKGVFSNGQEIAIKRLSTSSQQGAREFKNEVVVVAKLQHINLVRLLGFCLEGNEKILIYEFMPNKSLDYFLYDHTRKGQLNWAIYYKIIGGIARGMLYLHEDSRLRIIHRDLKPSNVLLDHNLNPKISDFGLAKILGVDQTQGNTSRIVGTYGYMSPEYAMHGELSIKLDVYSFGILILEILTGKKINSFDQSRGAEDLLSYSWKHWNDGTPLELLDPNLGDSYSENEVVRCLQIGLLCIQDDPICRPTMASIVLMLDSFAATFPTPQRPILSIRRMEGNMMLRELGSSQSTSKSIPLSVNEISLTEVVPR